MISRLKNSLLLLFLSVAWLPLAAVAQDDGAYHRYYPENILAFAKYLLEEHEYLRAVGEFQRYLYLAPSAANADSVHYLMAKAALQGGDCDRSLKALENLGQKFPGSPLASKIGLYRAIVFYNCGDYHAALKAGREDKSDCVLLNKLLTALSQAKLGHYDSARKSLELPSRIESADSTCAPGCFEKIRKLSELIPLPETLHFKKPFVAATFSAIVPGAGKVYCGRTMDGFYSLLLIGLCGWQAYDGFRDDGANSARGIIFGGLAGTFYLANIYGSAIAARLHNEILQKNISAGLQIEVNLP